MSGQRTHRCIDLRAHVASTPVDSTDAAHVRAFLASRFAGSAPDGRFSRRTLKPYDQTPVRSELMIVDNNVSERNR
jgi:hypothetical protein